MCTDPRRVGILVVCVLAASAPARAERTDRESGFHAAGMLVLGGAYLTMELPLAGMFARPACRWCDPPGFDHSLRERLRWERTARISLAGDVVGFAASPLTLSSLMVAAAGEARSLRRTFDDLAPMVEAAIVVSLAQSALKYTVRRARPFVRAAGRDRAWHHDDHHSFWSGHTSAVFAETVACGLVARQRRYRLEPAIWATGLTLGVATGYLRIAADKHYVSDVVLGAALGALTGAVVAHLHRGALRDDTPATSVTRASQGPQLVSFGGAF